MAATYKIDDSPLYKLDKEELYQMMSDVCDLVRDAGPEALKIADQQQDLVDAVEELGNTLGKNSSNPITKELKALDVRRDDAIIGVRSMLNGYARHKDLTKRKYANDLLEHIGTYGTNIAGQSYPVETASLTNLVKDWKAKKDLAEAVSKLNLLDWQVEIEESNKLFSEKYVARTKSTGEATSDNTTPARDLTEKAYASLENIINARYAIAVVDKIDATPYLNLMKSINALLTKYRQLNRNTKKDDKGTNGAGV